MAVIRPEIQELLDMFENIGLQDFPEMGAELARATFAELRVAPDNLPPLYDIADRSIPGPVGDIPVRVYRPDDSPDLPVLVWFHGGGWVLGDLETGELPCRTMAHRAGCAIVSVEYRLAPESTFPAAYDDCMTALQWVADHTEELGVDPSRIAVGGDSAGGNLAAVAALEAAERGLPVVFQLLVYPAVEADFTNLSYTENGNGYFLTRRGMQWFWDQYTTPEQRSHPRVAPLANDLASSGLAPAWVFTAEYDPLRDEGRRYAAALEEAGVPVERAHADDMIHGIFGMTLECGEEVRAQASNALRRAFAGNTARAEIPLSPRLT